VATRQTKSRVPLAPVLIAALAFTGRAFGASGPPPCTSLIHADAAWLAAEPGTAQKMSLFPDRDANWGALGEPAGFHLQVSGAGKPCAAATSAPAMASARRDRPSPGLTAAVTFAPMAVIAAVEYALWWHNGTRTPFHFTNEHWFGSDTYAGGADKASHIVGSYMVQQAYQALYGVIGHPVPRARLYSVLASMTAGVLIEVGDGFKAGGFSWQDLTADAIGIVTGAGIGALGIEDVVGMRWGQTGTPVPSNVPASNYSNEMYLVDAKLGGILHRLGTRPGLARFVLLSASYSAQGYRWAPPEQRRRNIGLELGPNLAEILRALGVRDDSWWGKPLLIVATYYRPPYTTIGIRYDLNSQQWYGPDFGSTYRVKPPGPAASGPGSRR
jgi:uncharacterized protein YfiM (DUF2279 family)